MKCGANRECPFLGRHVGDSGQFRTWVSGLGLFGHSRLRLLSPQKEFRIRMAMSVRAPNAILRAATYLSTFPIRCGRESRNACLRLSATLPAPRGNPHETPRTFFLRAC